MRRTLSALVLLFSVLSPASLEAAQSFAYVATCGQSTSCAAPQLLVYDANTARLVTAIDLPPGTPRSAAIAPDGTRLYVSIAGSSGARLAVIDTTAHVLSGSYAAPVAGRRRGRERRRPRLRPGDRQAAARPIAIVYAFDTSTHAFAPFVTAPTEASSHRDQPGTRSPLRDVRVGPPKMGFEPTTPSLVPLLRNPRRPPCLMPSTCRGPTALAVSPDGNRVYYADRPFGRDGADSGAGCRQSAGDHESLEFSG